APCQTTRSRSATEARGHAPYRDPVHRGGHCRIHRSRHRRDSCRSRAHREGVVMSAMTLPTDPTFYASIAASIIHRRRNDPWDGPTGTARPNQLPPDGDWQTWMILAGRGFGKTRSGAEDIRKRVLSGKPKRNAIAGPTAAHVRALTIDVGTALVAVSERAAAPVPYRPSERRGTFASGAVAILVSADEPRRCRGVQCDTFWAAELASWRYADAWDQLQLGHRL